MLYIILMTEGYARMDVMHTMEELVAELNQYNYHYYTLDAPQVSDKEYDVLYDKLVAWKRRAALCCRILLPSVWEGSC